MFYKLMVSGVSVQHRRWLEKRPAKSIKKLCSFVSIVYGLRERFLTAIFQVIVAGGYSHQPLTSI
jgi:4-hydroxy-3-methylbut-2-enyl diphosphate reductase IspH